MVSPISPKAYNILPWTDMPGNKLGMEWWLRKAEEDKFGNVQILNCRGAVVSDTDLTPWTYDDVMTANKYFVEVMNAVHLVRGNHGKYDDGMKGFSWDAESVQHIAPFREALELIKRWWSAFEDKSWAQGLTNIIQRDPATVISSAESVSNLLNVGKYNEASFDISTDKENQLSMSISTTDRKLPLITLQSLDKSLDIMRKNRVEAGRKFEELEWRDLQTNDIDSAVLEEAKRQLDAAIAQVTGQVKMLGDHIVARNVPWKTICVPTANAFKLWENPSDFCALTTAARKGACNDMETYGGCLAGYNEEAGIAMIRAAQAMRKGVACFDDHTIDRNLASMCLSSDERSTLYALSRPTPVLAPSLSEGASAAQKRINKAAKWAEKDARRMVKGKKPKRPAPGGETLLFLSPKPGGSNQ